MTVSKKGGGHKILPIKFSFLQLTSSASAVIWNEAEVCPGGKFRTPLVGVMSRSAKGVVTCQATETSVNVPLLLMTVKVVVEGMVVKEESLGGSAVGCVCVSGQGVIKNFNAE